MGIEAAVVVLLFSFAFLLVGAEFLIKGAAALAKKMGVPTLLIGLTIIAMGTSLPELITAIVAAIHGNPNIAVGSSIGSNIINITLLLGITALLMPLTIHPKMFTRDLPILFVVMAIIGLFLINGLVTRADGFILIICAGVYMSFLIWQSKRKTKETKLLTAEYKKEIKSKISTLSASLFLIAGLVILPLSSEGVVRSSIYIAHYFHISDLLIGLTIVAFGTSLSEFATSIVAAKRKEYDIVIGNIIGSNILNLLVVFATAAAICPIKIQPLAFYRDWSAMVLVSLLFYFLTYGRKKTMNITRSKGVILIIAYLLYFAVLLIS